MKKWFRMREAQTAAPDELRAMREKAGWTPERMADEMGVLPVEVTAWESGAVATDPRQAALIRWRIESVALVQAVRNAFPHHPYGYLMRVLRGLLRFPRRHPTLCGALVGTAAFGGWLALAPPGAVVPLGDGWLLTIGGALTLLVAIVARARGGKEDDDWSS